MKTPRNLSGEELTKLLGRFGYRVVRQRGSHMKLTTAQQGEHHLIVPRHGAVRVGTLHRILADVAEHFETNVEQVRTILFGSDK